MNSPEVHTAGLVSRLRELADDVPKTLSRRVDLQESLTRLHRSVEKSLARINPSREVQPSPMDLRLVRKALEEAWTRKDIGSLPPRDFRLSPWILFRDFRPAEQQSFTRSYLAASLKRASSRQIGLLAYCFALFYPTPLETFDQWRSGIRSLLARTAARRSPRLERWSETATVSRFLLPSGPSSFAKRLASEQDPKGTLQKAWTDEALRSGAYVAETFKALLKTLRGQLATGRIEPEGLRQLLSLSMSPEGRLRWPELARALGSNLLVPLSGHPPESPLAQVVKDYLLRCLGDPRIQVQRWSPIAGAARDVMFRWLVGEVLEDFYRILDRTAKERHWRYRKAFWDWYYQNGHVHAAWVALGPQARVLARRGDRERHEYASLTGAMADQSVLLMRMGSLTVAEWSHSGACWFWRSSAKGAPPLYQRSYRGEELRGTRSGITDPGAESFRHVSSDSGRWQHRIRSFLGRELNLWPHLKDLMP